MPASTDSAGGLLAAAWRPAGLLYLAAVLAGLAAGLFPEAIAPSKDAYRPAPLPVLQTVAVAQVAFILLVHPLIILARSHRGCGRRYFPGVLIESGVWLLLAAPFYAAGAYLADAVAADCVRTVIAVVCIWPLAWVAGDCLRSARAWRSPTVLILLLAAVGLPAAYYVAREFVPSADADWLWHLAPATFVWEAAGSHGESLLPGPAWALLVWPAVAAAGLLARLLLAKPSRASRQGR